MKYFIRAFDLECYQTQSNDWGNACEMCWSFYWQLEIFYKKQVIYIRWHWSVNASWWNASFANSSLDTYSFCLYCTQLSTNLFSRYDMVIPGPLIRQYSQLSCIRHGPHQFKTGACAPAEQEGRLYRLKTHVEPPAALAVFSLRLHCTAVLICSPLTDCSGLLVCPLPHSAVSLLPLLSHR